MNFTRPILRPLITPIFILILSAALQLALTTSSHTLVSSSEHPEQSLVNSRHLLETYPDVRFDVAVLSIHMTTYNENEHLVTEITATITLNKIPLVCWSNTKSFTYRISIPKQPSLIVSSA